MSLAAIPVVDISAFTAGGDGSAEAAEIERAAVEVGFFQIVGYASRANQDQELLDTVAEFFAKPVEEKIGLDNRNSAQFRGYTRLGTEITRGRADSREQIDYGPDREPLADVPAGQEYLRLQGHNLFPAAYPVLEERAMAWASLSPTVPTSGVVKTAEAIVP